MSLRRAVVPALALLVVLAFASAASAATSTSTAVVSSLNPSVTAAKVTFTATVAATSGGSVPAGNVRFLDNGTALGTVALSGGVAKFSTTALSVGSHAITARYLGTSAFSTSTSPALTQVVNRASTSVTLTSSPNPSASGATVTFAATVRPDAPAGGTPGGQVRFYEGTALLGSASLSGGTATFASSTLSAGTHSITATYQGNAKYAPSTSGTLAQRVDHVTTVVLSSSRNPSTVGDPVTLTATVSPASASGSISFADGSTSLGGAALNAGAASITTSALAAGSHSIVASYAGDADNPAASSSPLAQRVNEPGSTVAGPMAVISRDAPAYTNDDCGGSYPAANGDDADYESMWTTCNGRASATSPKWLAYDLSSVPAAQRRSVVVAWFNDPVTSEFDHTVAGGPAYDNVGAFSIEVSSAPGGRRGARDRVGRASTPRRRTTSTAARC